MTRIAIARTVGDDDEAGTTRSFLFADYSVECEGAEFDELVRDAWWLFFLWPVGVPLFFLALLVASNGTASKLSRAISFLHDDCTRLATARALRCLACDPPAV